MDPGLSLSRQPLGTGEHLSLRSMPPALPPEDPQAAAHQVRVLLGPATPVCAAAGHVPCIKLSVRPLFVGRNGQGFSFNCRCRCGLRALSAFPPPPQAATERCKAGMAVAEKVPCEFLCDFFVRFSRGPLIKQKSPRVADCQRLLVVALLWLDLHIPPWHLPETLGPQSWFPALSGLCPKFWSLCCLSCSVTRGTHKNATPQPLSTWEPAFPNKHSPSKKMDQHTSNSG